MNENWQQQQQQQCVNYQTTFMLISISKRNTYWLVRTSTSLMAIESRQTWAFAMVWVGCVWTWICLTLLTCALDVDVTMPEL